jgi:hypothetical protein
MATKTTDKPELEQLDNSLAEDEITSSMEYLRKGAEYLGMHPTTIGQGSRAVRINKLLLTSWVYGPQGMYSPLYDLVIERGIDIEIVTVAVQRLRSQGLVNVDLEACEIQNLGDLLQRTMRDRIVPKSNTAPLVGKCSIRAMGISKSGGSKAARPTVQCPWCTPDSAGIVE